MLDICFTRVKLAKYFPFSLFVYLLLFIFFFFLVLSSNINEPFEQLLSYH